MRIEIPIYFESPGKAPTYNWCLSEGAKATNNSTAIQMQILIQIQIQIQMQIQMQMQIQIQTKIQSQNFN